MAPASPSFLARDPALSWLQQLPSFVAPLSPSTLIRLRITVRTSSKFPEGSPQEDQIPAILHSEYAYL